MARGIALPIRPDRNGRVVTVMGDEEASKIILTAMGNCENENPFQQELGLGDRHIFDIMSPMFKGNVIGRLVTIFREFEAQDLYRLEYGSIQWSQEGPGVTTLTFSYVNLETDEIKTLSRQYGAT
jgi:hypothetical protein